MRGTLLPSAALQGPPPGWPFKGALPFWPLIVGVFGLLALNSGGIWSRIEGSWGVPGNLLTKVFG